MAKRQKQWATRKREELLDLLGRQCAFCGTTENLTFDCIQPKGDAHHRMERSQRFSFYRAQYFAGNLQVLCAICNDRKGNCITVPSGKEAA